MGTPEKDREPCPDRILDDIGGAFGMGAMGGSAFHYLKGVYNSPRGERHIGGAHAVRLNAPRLGGSFAIWGGLFSAADCTMVYARQKEDPWNPIIAGAATGGFLQIRHGLRPAGRSAIFGGLVLAIIEGAGITFDKVMSAQEEKPVIVEEASQPAPNKRPGFQLLNRESQPDPTHSAAATSSSKLRSRFGDLFRGKQEEKPKVKTQVLESFDSPIPPTFEFNS